MKKNMFLLPFEKGFILELIINFKEFFLVFLPLDCVVLVRIMTRNSRLLLDCRNSLFPSMITNEYFQRTQNCLKSNGIGVHEIIFFDFLVRITCTSVHKIATKVKKQKFTTPRIHIFFVWNFP